ncbi:MAG: rRNA maturation RNase YbeY [Trueperaceae bacterium]|nr:rRNA maturation RNase YbeY [Trueperaceae bacterium]
MVEILDETERFPAPERLRNALQALLDEGGLSSKEVTVVLLDDAAMTRHNERDRGASGPTDVLSYPSFEPDDVGRGVPEVAHLGDVLIGVDVAARQAAHHGHDLAAEVLVLAAHGLTHLRGLDHATEAAWAPFHAAQRRILELAPE